MALIPLDVRRLPLGEPIPVTIYDPDRNLLLREGNVITSERQLEGLISRGAHVDEEAFQAWVRWRARGGRGAIPDSEFTPVDREDRFDQMDLMSAVASLQQRVMNTLRDPSRPDFLSRLEMEIAWLQRLLQRDPDGLLLLLMHQAGTEIRNYAPLHSLVCAAVCELAADEWNDWDPGARRLIPHVALTMNLAILRLQDELAYQKDQLNLHQRAMVQGHGARSARMLDSLGVRDLTWLAAVERHHQAPADVGPGTPPWVRLARLVQRGDLYTATLSPRAHRPALPATKAGRGVLLNELGQNDAAGAALLRHLGVYPPGTLVRLASEETAVVLQRGPRPNQPVVAAVLRPDGMLYSTPQVRLTHLDTHTVLDAVASGDSRVRLNLTQLMELRRSL